MTINNSNTIITLRRYQNYLETKEWAKNKGESISKQYLTVEKDDDDNEYLELKKMSLWGRFVEWITGNKSLREVSRFISSEKFKKFVGEYKTEELQIKEDLIVLGQKIHQNKEKSSFLWNKINELVLGEIISGDVSNAKLNSYSSLIDYLNNHVDEKGLWRKSGNSSTAKQLLKSVSQNAQINFHRNAHDVVSAAKLILKNIGPMFRFNLSEDLELNKEALKSAIQDLPETNKELLRKTLDHLQKVKNSPSSRMTAENLGIIFGPNLFKILTFNEAEPAKELAKALIENPADFGITL